jgi:2-keto-4-pentenoate hydratase
VEERVNGKIERLARSLAEAWRLGGSIPLPAAREAASSRAEAYAVQDRMAELIGGRVAGWKVGASVRAVQIFEGHDGPLPGRIFADRLLESPARFPSRLVCGAKVECEFALRLTRDLPRASAPFEPADLADILTYHPAIELSATRYAPGTGNRALTTYDGIADNGSGAAAVLGAAVSDWHDLPFETMLIEARLDGSPPIQMYSAHYRRHPLDITAETFSELTVRGIELPAGTCLLTGSLSLPTPIRAGQTLTVKFAHFPQLSLTLT